MNLIYDFETLGPADTGAVVSMAILKFDESRYTEEPYTYDELLYQTDFIKFNVEEQVKQHGRIIDKSTLAWWQKKSPEAREQLKPSAQDRSIQDLWTFFIEYLDEEKLAKVYTRGNGFDPIVLETVLNHFGKAMPYPWWIIRDTRSMLDGMLWGTDIDNKFIPAGLEEKFVHHDPRHDIVMDVMRMQTVASAL